MIILKLIFFIIFMLSTLFLTSCEQNTNLENDTNVSNKNNEENAGTPLQENTTERISYRDYIEKYGNENDEEIVNNTEDNTTNEDESAEDETAIIPDNQLSTYSTPLLSSTKERINNIKIVCDRLNNFILNPNETFSYNNVTGPFGPDDGFQEATILLSDGTKTEGYGGGVCQLSSTLYNVVKNIQNVEITERHNHSAPVAYVPEGEDATVSLQSNLDFKFVNNTIYPIKFEAKCANGNVTVTAFREN